MQGKFNCISVKYGTGHGIFLARLCVRSNYSLKIIHLFNLVNTFYNLFIHITGFPYENLFLEFKLLTYLSILTFLTEVTDEPRENYYCKVELN